MRALSVRQPYAELILRGLKTIEYRSRATRIVGERFHLYAAGKWPARRAGATAIAGTTAAAAATPAGARAWSLDLAMPGPAGSDLGSDVRSGDGVPPRLPLPWLVELANGLRLFPGDLPTGVIVGSAVIAKVDRRDDGMWQWHLVDVERAATPRKPARHPQPSWFEPF